MAPGTARAAGPAHLQAPLLVDLAQLTDDLVVVLQHVLAALGRKARGLVLDHGAGLRAWRQVSAELAHQLVARSARRLELAERRREREQRRFTRGRSEQVHRG